MWGPQNRGGPPYTFARLILQRLSIKLFVSGFAKPLTHLVNPRVPGPHIIVVREVVSVCVQKCIGVNWVCNRQASGAEESIPKMCSKMLQYFAKFPVELQLGKAQIEIALENKELVFIFRP